MSAYYDSYDYHSYWVGRDYEHCAEKIAIESILSNLGEFNHLIEIGAGYGRLTKIYEKYAKKVTISDPSKQLISIAKKTIKGRKFFFEVGDLSYMAQKHKNKYDLVIMVRVLHHIDNIENAIKNLSTITRKGGYLLLEYANKLHFKSICREIANGNLNFAYDMSPKLVGKKQKNCIPFLNYHPKIVYETLQKYKYKILTKRSVSNIRNSTIKKYVPLNLMLILEKLLQSPFAKLHFGPSIFVLAQKS
ncbi:MAG: methyltransferase domain-containing protein [Patescibacteria group bacterium]|nr:methyltransferase domain-containing protein [Patescibacteria group bacterium]